MAVFIKGIVKGFADQGYGEQIDENVLWSPFNSRTLDFEPVLVDDGDEASEVIGVSVYSNGVQIFSSYYTDEDFEKKLTTAVLSELDIL